MSDLVVSGKRELEDCSDAKAIPVSSPKRKKIDCASETQEDSSQVEGLREKDVGITEYISDHHGFSAVLKERYSDFLVYEINLEGKVARLTDITPSEEEECTNKVTDILNTEDHELLKNLSSDEKTSEPVVIDVTNKDKEARRQVHEAIRQNFPGLESTTKNKDTSMVIIVKKANNKSRQTRQQWPASRGNYTHFVLFKENRDTQDAIGALASILRLPQKHFSYAGTKDKRAKTTQMVSAYRLPEKSLLSVNGKSYVMKVGNIEFKEQPIKLGDLSGNKFVIILRRLQGNFEEVEHAMNSLESKGFINYYGMQRFGTMSVPTHHVGRALLESKWKEAIDLILQPRTGEKPDLSVARQIWHKTQDAHKAFNSLIHKGSIEGRLLCGLKSHNRKDFVNALNAIPRNVRLMYVHSYQSYIWNKVVSRRIKTHGLKVLVGDLIMAPSANCESDAFEGENAESIETSKISPKCVTEEEVATVSINEVVLPLPGHSILFPKNETAEWYKEFLEEDGMDLNSFTSRVKTYSLGGSYRNLVANLKELKWEIIPYEDFCKPLVLSDWDVLNGIPLPLPDEDGQHKALKLEFHLPSSCYATMAVREILKMDTSRSAQKNLTSS